VLLILGWFDWHQAQWMTSKKLNQRCLVGIFVVFEAKLQSEISKRIELFSRYSINPSIKV